MCSLNVHCIVFWLKKTEWMANKSICVWEWLFEVWFVKWPCPCQPMTSPVTLTLMPEVELLHTQKHCKGDCAKPDGPEALLLVGTRTTEVPRHRQGVVSFNLFFELSCKDVITRYKFWEAMLLYKVPYPRQLREARSVSRAVKIVKSRSEKFVKGLKKWPSSEVSNSAIASFKQKFSSCERLRKIAHCWGHTRPSTTRHASQPIHRKMPEDLAYMSRGFDHV